MEPSDQPDIGDARDRVAVHLVWDGVLLAAAIGAVILVYTRSSETLSGDSLRAQLVAAGASMLLATGFAVSLRAAVPNLAVGGTAAAAGVLVGWLVNHEHMTVGSATGVTAAAGAGVGLLLAIAVVALRAPAWAVSLAAVALLGSAILSLTGGAPVILTSGPNLLRWPYPVFLGAAALSVAGGAVALAPRARAALGAFRPTGDPARRRPRGGSAVAVVALVVSSVLATGAGLVTVFRLHEALPVDTSLTSLTLPAVGAALLGGVSVHGRRGGVFGTALAVVVIQSLLLWFGLGNAEQWVPLAVVGAAILVGLIVSRVVETLGSPREPEPALADVDGPPPWAPPAAEPGYDTGYQPRYDTGYQPVDTDRY